VRRGPLPAVCFEVSASCDVCNVVIGVQQTVYHSSSVWYSTVILYIHLCDCLCSHPWTFNYLQFACVLIGGFFVVFDLFVLNVPLDAAFLLVCDERAEPESCLDQSRMYLPLKATKEKGKKTHHSP